MTTEAPWEGIENVKWISAVNHPERGVTLLAVTAGDVKWISAVDHPSGREKLFDVIQDFTVHCNMQLLTGGTTWGGWSDRMGEAGYGLPIAGAQHALGLSQAWALSTDGRLKGRLPERGDKWNEAGGPALRSIASVQWNVTPDRKNPVFSQSRAVIGKLQLWGVTMDWRVVHANLSAMSAEGWDGSEQEGSWNDAPPANAVAATMKNDNTAQVWILDKFRRLRSTQWDQPTQSWTAWSGPDEQASLGPNEASLAGWNGAPKLRHVAVSQHRGAVAVYKAANNESVETDHIILGVTLDNQLIASRLRGGSGGVWEPWSAPGWNGAPRVTAAAAVQQSDGCLQVWVVDTSGRLATIRQTKRGGDWGPWQQRQG